MASQVLEILIKARNQAGAALKDADRQTDRLSKRLKGMRTQLLAATAAGAGLGIASIKLASDLEEARSAAEQTFKDSAEAVTTFAEEQASAFNISKASAFEYTAQLGAIFNATGLAGDASADSAVQFTKLAADLASFRNLRFEDALQKIRAGLVGEAEPLRTVGVLLSAARVEQVAYAEGIAAAGAELTEAQKVQARQIIIMQDLADAQGDVERTADSVANQMRSAQASLADAGAEIGTILLPIVADLLQHINKLIDFFSDLPRPIKQAILIFGAVGTAIAAVGVILPPLIVGVKALSVAIGVLVGASGIGLLLIALAALTAAVVLVIKNWDKLEPAIADGVNKISRLLTKAINFWLDTHINPLIKAYNAVAQIWGQTVDELEVHIPEWESAHAQAAEATEEYKDTVVAANNAVQDSYEETVEVVTEALTQEERNLKKSQEVIAQIEADARLARLEAANQAIKDRHAAEAEAKAELEKLEMEHTKFRIEQAEARAKADGADIGKRLREARELAGVVPLDRLAGANTEVRGLRGALSDAGGVMSPGALADRLGLTGAEREEFIRRQQAAQDRLMGRAGGGGAVGGIGGALPSIPIIGAVEPGRAQRTEIAAAGIEVTNIFEGPVSPDVADQIEEAISEAVRSGRLQGEGV